jgi:hypothetical protein
MTNVFTDEDRALIEGDTPDLVIRERAKIVLVQPSSKELIFGDRRFVTGAAAGVFVIPRGGLRVPVACFAFVPIGFDKVFNEYLPNRGNFVAPHLEKPADAIWLDARRDGVEKTGLVRPNGNRVVETITVFVLLDGDVGASFEFYGSSLAIGRDFAGFAQRQKGIGGFAEAHGYAVGKFKMTSFLEKSGDLRWFKPAATLLGVLGEADGPPIEKWRLAQTLRRQGFKQGVNWMPLEALSPPEPPDDETPARDGVVDLSKRGAIDIGTGKGRWPRAVETPPPPDRYEGPDDDIPF